MRMVVATVSSAGFMVNGEIIFYSHSNRSTAIVDPLLALPGRQVVSQVNFGIIKPAISGLNLRATGFFTFWAPL